MEQVDVVLEEVRQASRSPSGVRQPTEWTGIVPTGISAGQISSVPPLRPEGRLTGGDRQESAHNGSTAQGHHAQVRSRGRSPTRTGSAGHEDGRTGALGYPLRGAQTPPRKMPSPGDQTMGDTMTEERGPMPAMQAEATEDGDVRMPPTAGDEIAARGELMPAMQAETPPAAARESSTPAAGKGSGKRPMGEPRYVASMKNNNKGKDCLHDQYGVFFRDGGGSMLPRPDGFGSQEAWEAMGHAT